MTPEQPGQDSSRIQSFVRRAALSLSGVALILLVVFAYDALTPDPPTLSPQQVDDLVAQAIASATPPPAFSAQVYPLILPSLVLIQTHKQDQGREGSGVGTGVVVNAGGDVLTALHVVSGAEEIELHFADGSQSPGEVIATDPENDIAVVHPADLPDLIVPAVLGSSGGLRVGDEVFAVGNPFGLAASMTAGVISGFDRSFTSQDGKNKLEGLIQFDAAVNPGNSGGPLLNRSGQVVGIVTALANPSDQGFFIGIGFAVPIGTAGGAAGAPDY